MVTDLIEDEALLALLMRFDTSKWSKMQQGLMEQICPGRLIIVMIMLMIMDILDNKSTLD